MTIRRKVFILYALTALGVLVFLFAGARVILVERLARLEQADVRTDMDRVLAVSGGILDNLLATARDYGNWDDTYTYLAEPSEAYIQANFIEATFLNLKLEMVLLVDTQGRPVFSRGFDLEAKEMRPVPESWLTAARIYGLSSPAMIQGSPDGRKGLALTPDGPLMLVAKPVLTSQAKGPARGVLVMGRRLGREDVSSVASMTLVNAAWLSLDELPVNVGLVDLGLPARQGGEPVLVRPLSGSRVMGLCLARDMMGAPIGAWRIETDRQLYAKGLAGMIYFLGVTLAGGMIFALAFAYILERVVLGRLAGLNAQVRSMSGGPDRARRVAEGGSDEIGRLGESINGLLEGQERADAEREAIAVQLKAAKEAAEEASLAKSRFLATMSHEIRTPLNALLGFTELASMEKPNGKVGEYLQDILGASAQLRTLIEDVLDFSKIEAGRLQLENAPYVPAMVLEEAVRLVRTKAQASNVELVLEADPALPGAARGDSLRLRQVLVNLLDNAIKFSPGGRVALTVRSGREEAGGVPVRFEVSDTGQGMSPEVVDRLFRPFMQADSSTTRRFGGTGLGLAICRQLVELMGARLEVASNPGQGSVFSFTLAMVPCQCPPEAESCRQQDANLAGATILVAEDNAFNRKILQEMLSQAGARLVLAEDGTRAVMAAVGESPDLILMDVNMPGMDGLEATRAIRAHGCCTRVPIVALTAGALSGEREKCLEAGMDDYLTKPVSRQALLSTLGRWLKGRRPGAAAGPAVRPADLFEFGETDRPGGSRPTSGHSGREAGARVAQPSEPGGRGKRAERPAASGALSGPGHGDQAEQARPPVAGRAALPDIPGLDLEAALALYESDVSLLSRVLASFPDSFRDTPERLRALLEAGDAAGARIEAHGLKGGAGGVGATELARLAARMETALDAKDLDRARYLLGDLRSATNALLSALEPFAGRSPGPRARKEQ